MKYLILLLIIINTLLASRWIIDGNLFFHTDIARDFLLLEDIVDNKHLTLIGPRSGAIPGLFHGPLWLYLNLPVFILGGGNPVFVGWFWVVLYILSLLITYQAGKRIFDKETGLLSALLLSSVTILSVRSLFNPYGALLLSPIFFYFFIKYLENQHFKNLLTSLLVLGFIIQFQMAFGVPILILTFIYLLYYLFKTKKLIHLLSLSILLVPLSSFLLFDLRNQFIQFKSVSAFLGGFESHGKLDLNLLQLITIRIKEAITDGLGVITQNNIYLSILLLLILVWGIYQNRDKVKARLIYTASSFFYIGFWFFTIFFKGTVWNYYYLPFIPLIIIVFVSLKNRLNKVVFYTIFILIYLVNVKVAVVDLLNYQTDPSKQDVSTWKFNKLVAEKVIADSEKEFGYFIFTPDLYGYSPRYAMNLLQKRNLGKTIYPYFKKPVTYLLIAPPPEYGKDPNSIWYQKNTNSKLWKDNDIRISRIPLSTLNFNNGFVIEKYNFSEEEIKVEPNPYLIKDIFFR